MFVKKESKDKSIICWGDEGNDFTIKDPEKLARDILPEYFRHNNYASFIR